MDRFQRRKPPGHRLYRHSEGPRFRRRLLHRSLPASRGQWTVRRLGPNGENWQRQDSEKDGSYLLFPSTEETITFCLVEEGNPLVKYLLTFTVLAAGLFILFWRRRMQKKKRTRTAAPSQQP